MSNTLESLGAWAPYFNFATAIAAIVAAIFYPDAPRKRAVLTLLIVIWVLLSVIGVHGALTHNSKVEMISERIVSILGTNRMTFDQIKIKLMGLPGAESLAVSEARDNLVDTNKVGYKIIDVRDDLGNKFSVTVYYVSKR